MPQDEWHNWRSAHITQPFFLSLLSASAIFLPNNQPPRQFFLHGLTTCLPCQQLTSTWLAVSSEFPITKSVIRTDMFESHCHKQKQQKQPRTIFLTIFCLVTCTFNSTAYSLTICFHPWTRNRCYWRVSCSSVVYLIQVMVCHWWPPHLLLSQSYCFFFSVSVTVSVSSALSIIVASLFIIHPGQDRDQSLSLSFVGMFSH